MALVDMSRTGFIQRLVITGVVGLALLQAPPAAAQQSTVDFTVSGTSTIRGWTCEVSGTSQVTQGSSAPAPGFATGVQTATLTVPVSAFECPNEEMTGHLLEALKPDEFSEITFELEGYEASGQQTEATGALTIMGVTQPVSFPVALTPSGAGVEIEGDVRLDMTTYGVEPPVVMLGLMSVRPQIRIEFKGLITP
jgi:polyisoprenoid-binding protein YceI